MDGPPIQGLDSVDIVGNRQDGGVDLFIVSSSRLDGSVATQRLLQEKMETYVQALQHPDFQEEFGPPHPERMSIILTCVDEPAKEIVDFINKIRPFVEKQGASLEYQLAE